MASSDRETAFRELTAAGWSIIENSGHYIAAHDRATEPIRFGGRYGWNLAHIRREAARALGTAPRKVNRARQQRQHDVSVATTTAAQRAAATARTSDAQRRLEAERAVTARLRELRFYENLMRA